MRILFKRNRTKKKNTTFKERRLFTRIKKVMSIIVVFSRKSIPAKLIDLNGLGLGILSPIPLKPNNRINIIVINPKDYTRINIKGKVIWAKSTSVQLWRAGVKILQPAPFAIFHILAT